MAIRAGQAGMAKVVTFYKNGDKFFRGYKLAITPQRYRNMETLLNDLTRLLNLPLGARYVLTKTGKCVENLQQFENGQGYVCSSFPKLKHMRYGVGDNLPYWNSSKHPKNDKEAQSRKYYKTFKGVSEEASSRKQSHTIKPRIITVIRYGHKPRKSAKVLLNKRTAQTLDQVLDEVTAAIGVWGTNGVQCLYDFTGKRVNDLSDLFRRDDCFIAVGNEKFNLSDLDDIIHDSILTSPQSSRLPSINSNESDADQPEQLNVIPRRLQAKNFVKLPSIRRKSNADNNENYPDVGNRCKENKVQKQTLSPPKEIRKKKSPQNSHTGKKHESNQTVEDVSNENHLHNIEVKIYQETKPLPQDTQDPLLISSCSEDYESKNEVENVDERYTMGEKIGDGNFAIVRIGIRRETKQKHALKIIDKKKIVGKENMLKDEIRLMKACNHENIVKLYETLDTAFDVYLVMELVTGGDLFDEISNAVKFEEPVASSFAQDIANALDYLHQRNVVHRDLKPENLLVHTTPNGHKQLKLADFGLAVEVKVPLFTVCGTPTYVAPEILCEIGYGLKVDIWAAGVILYIMLCGFPPFRSPNKDQDELFDLIISGDFEFLEPYWDEVSEDAKDLVSSLLVVESNHRLRAHDILSHHWIQKHGSTSKDEELCSPKHDFNAKRKFKGAAIAVKSSNRLQNIVQLHFKRGEKLLNQRNLLI